MRELEQTIREILGPDDAKLFDAFGEQPLRKKVLESFRGKLRWLVALAFVAIGAFVVLAVLAAIQLLQAQTLSEQVIWAVAVGTCVFAAGLMKAWYWMELNRAAVARELQRLELLVARLLSEIRPRSGP